MSAFTSIGIILIFLFAGIISAKLKIVPQGRYFSLLLSFSLFMLLFFMGFRIGRNEEIGKALKTIGIVSVTFAASTAAGTGAVLFIVYSIRDFIRNRRPGRAAKERSIKGPDAALLNIYASSSDETGGKSPSGSLATGRQDCNNGGSFFHHLKEPLKLVAFVMAGFASGWVLPFFPGFTGADATTWLLYLLLFLIGAQLVNNNVTLKDTLAHPETAILPLGTIAGSLLGALAAAPFLSISPGKALALASGFGWYSLSGVIITDMGDPVLGSAGFLINLFRENIALLTIPFIARSKYPNIGIGIAGATSMDVTLPLIEKSMGDRVVPLAISSGAILSLAVPFMVPVFFQAG